MRATLVALSFALLSGPTFAMDARPLLLADAAEAVGSAVMTSDNIKLGHLVAFADQGAGEFLCFVQLDPALRVETSPLIVAGLLRSKDGTLRLSEDAATIAERMKLPLVLQ